MWQETKCLSATARTEKSTELRILVSAQDAGVPGPCYREKSHWWGRVTETTLLWRRRSSSPPLGMWMQRYFGRRDVFTILGSKAVPVPVPEGPSVRGE